MKIKNKWARILVLMIIWLALAGGITPATVGVGGAVIFLAMLVSLKLDTNGGWLGDETPEMSYRFIDILRRIGATLLFIPIFLREIYSAAVNVGKHAVEIKSTMHPGIVRFPTNLKSKTAVVVLANLITLTPGTLTMDFDDDKHCFYVHCIDADMPQNRQVIIEMECWLRRIFE